MQNVALNEQIKSDPVEFCNLKMISLFGVDYSSDGEDFHKHSLMQHPYREDIIKYQEIKCLDYPRGRIVKESSLAAIKLILTEWVRSAWITTHRDYVRFDFSIRDYDNELYIQAAIFSSPHSDTGMTWHKLERELRKKKILQQEVFGA